MKWPTYMPEARGDAVPGLAGEAEDVRSDMPMCMAMLQNQAKNMTCQKVNLTWPGSGSPPFQIWVVSEGPEVAESERTSAPVASMNCRRATMPKARKTSTIQGAAMLATLATIS